MGSACPALFCGTSESEGQLRGLCHGDAFMVAALRRRLAAIGELLVVHFEVRQTGHIGIESGVGESLLVLNRTQPLTNSQFSKREESSICRLHPAAQLAGSCSKGEVPCVRPCGSTFGSLSGPWFCRRLTSVLDDFKTS